MPIKNNMDAASYLERSLNTPFFLEEFFCLPKIPTGGPGTTFRSESLGCTLCTCHMAAWVGTTLGWDICSWLKMAMVSVKSEGTKGTPDSVF